MIFSVSSSAALRPTSGLAPAPSPLVSFEPIWSFTGACESFSACRSVLAAMNSTPSTLARIMRLTAFDPPPPTPITLILAPCCCSSLNEIRMPASLGIILPPLRFTYLSHRNQTSTLLSRKHALDLGRQRAGTLCRLASGTRPVGHQAHHGCVLGLGHLLRHPR